MARRDKEAMQDIALHHMDKINRQNQGETQVKSLADQLKEAAKSPSDRRKNMPSTEWYKDIRDIISMTKNCRISFNFWNWVSVKYKADIEVMRLNGDAYDTVIAFAKTKEMEYINR